jgi:hypothetical protein
MRSGDTAKDQAEQMAHFQAVAPQFIGMAANVFEPKTYYRYELPKYLSGFVALFEGDYRRVLTIIYALHSIASGKPTTYTVARGVPFSDKVTAIRATEYTSVVDSFEDLHHARNALTHPTYDIDYSGDIAIGIKLRDDYDKEKSAWGWEKVLGVSEVLGFFQKLNWVNQYSVAAFAQAAPADLRDALSQHWDPESHELTGV